MTIDDLKKMDTPFVTPAIAAKIIGCDPQYIRVAARDERETGRSLLGFPTTLMKSRVRIPRIPLIKYLMGELEKGGETT
jgi:hypothetical protein